MECVCVECGVWMWMWVGCELGVDVYVYGGSLFGWIVDVYGVALIYVCGGCVCVWSMDVYLDVCGWGVCWGWMCICVVDV